MFIDPKQYKRTGIISADPVVSLELKIKDEAFRPGTVRVHLPAPINASQLFEGQLLETEPFFRMASVEDYPQRSVFYDEELEENIPFLVKYAFHIEAEYREPDAGTVEKTEQPHFTKEQIERFVANESCDCGSYTGEMFERVLISDVAPGKKIEFTAEREAKLAKLKENATGRLSLIRAIYDYCSGSDIVEKNVEMVTLLRMAGVPARWQGGIDLRDCKNTSPVKACDWCLYYVAPYGWCFSDAKAASYEAQHASSNGGACISASCQDVEAMSDNSVGQGVKAMSDSVGQGVKAMSDNSVGQGVKAMSDNSVGQGVKAMSDNSVSQDVEAMSDNSVGQDVEAMSDNSVGQGVKAMSDNVSRRKEILDFYFCNIDPYRMPTASKYAASLYPAKDYVRADELTNYRGEVECGERGLGADEFDTMITCELA